MADFNPNCDYVLYEGWYATGPPPYEPPLSPPALKVGVPSGGAAVMRHTNDCGDLGDGWTVFRECGGVVDLGGWIFVSCPCAE